MSDNVVRRRIMVDNQIRPSDVTKFPIIEAFLSIKREVFVPSENRDTAYVGEHIRIGNDRVILDCLLYTSPSPRDRTRSRMPSSA